MSRALHHVGDLGESRTPPAGPSGPGNRPRRRLPPRAAGSLESAVGSRRDRARWSPRRTTRGWAEGRQPGSLSRSFRAESRDARVLERDVHDAEVGIEIETVPPAFAAEAAGLDASERGTQVTDIVGVEPDH